MKKPFLSLTFAATVLTLPAAAQSRLPDGGGGYAPPPSECVTPAQYRQIDSMLSRNIGELTRQGLLPAASQRPNTVPLGWPLRQAPGFGYNSIYGISNYVDHNTAYPNQVRDWNCGSRTYDTAAGYNHAGMDIYLWPFDINMMNSGQAQIVAAAPGTIVGRTDGNFDRNCAIGASGSWNAVYVQHSDGSVAWYGHMKSGSLTPKQLGANVAAGEVLGTVGSSGSSSGPHLHFELHAASGTVLDPYNGTCSPAATSWATQKNYYEPAINVLMTHAAPPAFAACPRVHTLNASDNFMPGATAYFATYYHDQQQGQPTTYTIYRPNNTVFASWTHSSSVAHYSSSYWYWTYNMPTTAVPGNWRFTASFQGTTVTHNFTVGAVPMATAASRTGAFTLAPNPAHGRVVLTLPAAPAAGTEASVRNALGQEVARHALTAARTDLPLPAAPGLYLVTLPTPAGPMTQKLLVE